MWQESRHQSLATQWCFNTNRTSTVTARTDRHHFLIIESCFQISEMCTNKFSVQFWPLKPHSWVSWLQLPTLQTAHECANHQKTTTTILNLCTPLPIQYSENIYKINNHQKINKPSTTHLDNINFFTLKHYIQSLLGALNTWFFENLGW